MVSSQFYDYNFSESILLEEILQWIESYLLKPIKRRNIPVSGVGSIENAIESEIVYISSASYLEKFYNSRSKICIVSEKFEKDIPESVTSIVVTSPERVFAFIASKLYTLKAIGNQREPIHPSARISTKAQIAPHVVIGPDVVIGDHVVIDPFVVVGPGVSIGNNTYIESNATLFCTEIGNHVRIGTGARIGQEGFGFIMDKQGHVTMPHLGIVQIKDHVRIGANTCIDRGVLSKTCLEKGCRVDNLVQVAHNVQIETGSVLAAQVGISGSTKIGKYVVMGGQVGITQHLNICDGVQIAAQSGVMNNIKEKMICSGSPAIPIMQWRRQNVILKKLAKKKRI